jgi:polysaccharide pyruvyl transferase CsaB
MERTVLVTGYYGFGNTGDEAILSALVAGIRKRMPSARIVATSGDPGQTQQRHGIDAIPWRDPLSIAEAVRRCDLVVIGGGGLFQDYGGVEVGTLLTPRHGGVTFYAGPAVLAALAKKPVALHGLGFGPLASAEARRIVRAVAGAAARISVRDAASRALLAEIGVPEARISVAADPAFLLSSEHVRPEDILIGMGLEPRAPIVGVALRPWSRGTEPAAWEPAVAAGLDLFVERTGATLLFVPFEKSPWTEDDDFALASRVRRRLARPDRAAVLSGLLAPQDTASLLAGCDLVLGMRFHATVFALAGAVPSVAIAYDPKVEALMARAGLDDFTEPVDGLSAASLAARMERAYTERDRLRAALSASAAAERQRAAEDLEGLVRLLENPPAPPAVAPEMLGLFEDALAANLQRTHELSAEVEILHADRVAQQLKVGDLEGRVAAAESIEAALRGSNTELAAGFETAAEAHRREVLLLEDQRVEAREELYRIQTSRLWRTINLYWRGRRALARVSRPARKTLSSLLGTPPADWVGADSAHAAAAAARSPTPENRCEIVLLPSSDTLAPDARHLAAAGHRVFAIDPGLASEGPPYAAREVSPGFFAVTLRAAGPGAPEAFDALDLLRRDLSLGATLVVSNSDWKPTAARLCAERAWPTVNRLGGEDAIATAFPKVSVVVVTWNGRDFNRLCLESLLARTEWPNLEILVVDNGSTDGTRELIEDAARRDARMRPIFHAENRGFAAGCNAGLAAASGEFLVILNNDTVVTRGWATALTRHLWADPTLGLVGPVTNAIANAAKVDAGYSEVGDLPAWAAEWIRAHDREAFDIPMLALFCTALPRRVYEDVGPLDERFGAGLFEDDDYNRRVREKGYAIRCARDAFVHHWQMASFRTMGKEEYFALYAENQRKYAEKWRAAPAPVPVAPPASPPAPRRFASLEEHREQLSHVLARVASSRGAVIFLPSVGWGIHLFQRPHHLARVFARLGYVAIFDSSNAADRVDGFREIEPNLFLFSGSPELLHEVPSPLLWAFPYNFHLADGYPKPVRTVYDWIDDLGVFPQDRELLERNHARGLAEATLVACVARRLYDEARAVRKDALSLPNGVEYERFAAPAAPPRDAELLAFLAPGAPVAGYYGALAEWFDYPLLERVAASKPDWRFVLIGPQYDKSLPGQPLLVRPNVRWIGPRDYVTLPGYLSLFDVATIPFRINAITQATSPLKLYEYFAGARPVVTTPMTECQAYPEVRIAATAEEFSRALDAAREQGRDPDFRAHLRALARENSWSARVMKVLRALDGR